MLTLTSFGMARRSRPQGRGASPVVALWKDPGRGTREISLEDGAQGVLISVSTDRVIRRGFDGRRPVENGSEVVDMSVYQVRAASTGSGWTSSRGAAASEPPLKDVELTILMSWAETVAEALTYAPERLDAVAADALGAPWRAALGISEPSSRLEERFA